MTKAVIYRPKHVKETIRNSRGYLVSCSDASFSMFADATTLGGVTISQSEVRKLTGRSRETGVNLRDLAKVAAHFNIPFYDKTGQTWAQLVKYLDEGRRVLIQVENWELNDCGRSKVGHAMFLQADRDRGVLGNNPLCAKAKWYKRTTLKRAAQVFAKATAGTSTALKNGGIRFAVSRKVPVTHK